MPSLIERVVIRGSQMTVRPARALRNFMPHDFGVGYDPAIDLAAIPEQIRLLPFLWQVAPIVWATDQELEVDVLDPRVSESFDAVRNELRAMYPSLGWRGEIKARSLTPSPPPQPSQLTEAALFSGGVDSTWTALKHSGKNLLLITIWGTHVALSDQRSWSKVVAKNSAFAEAHAGAFATIKSNLKDLNYLRLRSISDEVPHWWTLVQHGMSYTGVTAPLLYKHGIGTLHVGASYSPGFSTPWGSDPRIDDLISLGHARVHHDSYEVERQDKVQRIVAHFQKTGAPPAELRVCVDAIKSHGGNCERCQKCLRAQLGVFLVGGDPVEYGFPGFRQSLLDEVPGMFERFKYRFGEGQVYLWTDLKNHVPPEAEDAHPIWAWIRNFDFQRYMDEQPERRGPSREQRVALGGRFGRLYGLARAATKVRRRLSG